MITDFKEGQEVAHVGNLEKKLWVLTINKREIDIPTGQTDASGVKITEKKIRMEGITCHWWANDIIQMHKFHSRELVPWDIAEKGLEEVLEWQGKREYFSSK